MRKGCDELLRCKDQMRTNCDREYSSGIHWGGMQGGPTYHHNYVFSFCSGTGVSSIMNYVFGREERQQWCLVFLEQSPRSALAYYASTSSCKLCSSAIILVSAPSMSSSSSTCSTSPSPELQKSIPKNRLGDESAACSAKFFVGHLP